jgi:hypothetical protein
MIVLLTEEPSMRILLRSLITRSWPASNEGVDWQIIAHQGKADLERKIAPKMSSWNFRDPHFIILRDNDGGDCLKLKARLSALAAKSGKPHQVRIVCQELESWLIGDLSAVKAAYPKAPVRDAAAKFRDPDKLGNVSDELSILTGELAKVERAALVSAHLEPSRNRSRSFQVLFKTLQQHLG